MRNSDILKALMPVDLGAVSDADAEIEGARLDEAETAAAAYLSEAFPDTCDVLIAEWERVCAIIPPLNAPLEQRRAAVLQRLRTVARLDLAYFVFLAATVGYAVTIEEMPPFAPDYGSGEDTVWVWRVRVVAGQKPITHFTAGDSSAGDLLTDWQAEPILENIIQEFKPAHTEVYFVYE